MATINQRVSVRSGRISSFFTSTHYVPCVAYSLFIVLAMVATTNNQANAQRISPLIDICLQFSDNCPSCISTDSCGFCQDTGLCLTGDVNGPGGNPNNCTDWFFLECPITICATFTTCRTCVADSLCGWCFDTLLCEPGSISGPVTGVCRNFVFANRNLCNSPSPSSRSTTGVKTTGKKVSKSTGSKTTGQKTTGKKKNNNKSTGSNNRSTGRPPSHSNSPSNFPSLLASTSSASFQQPIYMLFYMLLALSSIAIVVTNF